MRNLSNHCAVIKLFEYVETRDCVYIMMEAAKRGWVLLRFAGRPNGDRLTDTMPGCC